MTHEKTERDSMTPAERLDYCDRYTAWIDLKARMESEWQAIRAARKAGAK